MLENKTHDKVLSFLPFDVIYKIYFYIDDYCTANNFLLLCKDFYNNFMKNKARHYKFNILYESVNGQDVLEVYKKTIMLKDQILKKNKPAILHAKVRRKFAHSGVDIDLEKKYRIKDNSKIQNNKSWIEIPSRVLY